MGTLRVARAIWSRWKRPFDVLQIEPTTHCFLRCPFCPHESLRSRWISQHMSMALFDRLSQHFHLTRAVHLQGWGEPLLHPEVFRMVKRAKDAGCLVGFTTNGMLLSEDVCRRLMKAGIDSLAVSIAGATASTHASLRVGSDLTTILGNLANLARLKTRLGAKRPRVILSFLMTRSNISELPAAIDLARDAGVDGVDATNLSNVTDRWQDLEKLFSTAGTDGARAEIVDEARRRAADSGVTFHVHSLDSSKEAAVCCAMPIHNLFIAADGGVYPCAHLATPVDPIPRLFQGEWHEMARRPFGNINESGLLGVWGRREFRAFRDCFRKRKLLGVDGQVGGPSSPLPADGVVIPWAAVSRKSRNGPPLPAVCATCYLAWD